MVLSINTNHKQLYRNRYEPTLYCYSRVTQSPFNTPMSTSSYVCPANLIWNNVSIVEFLKIRNLKPGDCKHGDWPDEVIVLARNLLCSIHVFEGVSDKTRVALAFVVSPSERFLIKQIKSFIVLLERITDFMGESVSYILFVSKYTPSVKLLTRLGVATFSKADMLVSRYHMLQKCTYRLVSPQERGRIKHRIGVKLLSTGVIAKAHGFAVGDIVECRGKRMLLNNGTNDYYIVSTPR